MGDAVRVRQGVVDPDFPDIPLGGWAGLIRAVDGTTHPLYLVRWTPETLARITPVYRVRCDHEEMDAEETWLDGRDLEPDAGGPLAIVAPLSLTPRRLDGDEPDDRVRKIFGLTGDDPLPPLDTASLRRFHEHFGKKLKLPQPGQFDDPAAYEVLMVQRLLPFEEGGGAEGLLVEVAHPDGTEVVPLAEVSLLTGNAAGRDVLAYGLWFVESQPEAGSPELPPEFIARLPSLQMILGQILLACILLGALFGAILWAHDLAVLMAQWGGLLLGALGLMIGARTEMALRRRAARPPRFILGLVIGTLLGGAIGAVGAVFLLGFLGAIPGAILGTLLGQLLTALGSRGHGTVRLTFLGAYLGAGVYVFTLGTGEPIPGAVYGALGGVGLFVVGYVGMTWLLSRLPMPRP